MKRDKKHSRIGHLLNAIPEAVEVSNNLVVSDFFEDKPYPLILSPEIESVKLPLWLARHTDEVEAYLRKYGAVLFRGFGCSIEDFDQVSECFGKKLSYEHRSSPRTEIGDKIYTSTDYPPDQVINMHSENSYSTSWPRKLLFYCDVMPEKGGETPIASTRSILHQLKTSTIEKFKELGILYKRRFDYGMKWEEVFQTQDRSKVEEDCRSRNIDFRWSDHNEKLTLEWVRPAIHHHPDTGEEVWFNHAFFFHASNFARELREAIGVDALPFSTFFGNGEEIPSSIVKELEQAYKVNAIYFRWQEGDILLLDNMLMAHGRNSFHGPRRILVAMT